METKKVYLKQNVQVEPLIYNWYAWAHLLSPATAAINLVERYMKIMQSYIHSPMLHAAAVKDPAMRGGPFINLDSQYAGEVKALLGEMQQNKRIIEFTQAVRQLNQLLKDKAKGYSLEPLYAEVPDILRGYVELFYDLNHCPSFRFFEALLYKSPYYSIASQTVALSFIDRDGDRPFILSTPKLRDGKSVHLPIPFVHPGLDELFRMKKTPQTWEYILEKLNVPIGNIEFFRSFFTHEAPPAYQGYTGNNMRIRYFGHACILIETRDISILLDPVLSYTYESDISRYTYLDLPETIDYILITHSHQDHILLETMLQLRHKVKNIIIGRNMDGMLQDPSLKLALEELGFSGVREIRELQEIPIPGGSIMGLPFLGEHHDLLIHSKLGYYINIEGRSVLAVADSCNIEPRLYEHIHRHTGDVDVLFLGMECDGAPVSWAYGPLFDQPVERNMDRSRRGRGCNYQEGIDLVERFNCREVYVYAMGQEPWLRHILDLEYTDESNPVIQSKKLIEACTGKGIIAERLFGEKEILAAAPAVAPPAVPAAHPVPVC